MDLSPNIDGAGAVRLTWSKADVCHALGVSAATFDKHRAELERAGFPRRLPGLNLWSIAAVTDWIATNAGTALRPAPAPLGGDIQRVAGALDRLYGDAAGKAVA